MNKCTHKYIPGKVHPIPVDMIDSTAALKYSFIDSMGAIQNADALAENYSMSTEWMVKNLNATRGILCKATDPVTELPIHFTKEMLCEQIKKDTSVDITDILPNLENDLDKVNAVYIIFINEEGGYQSPKHFHAPVVDANGNVLDDTRTTTIIIPIKIVDDKKTSVCFNYQESPKIPSTLFLSSGWFSETVNGYTQSIEMPSAGQYLIIDFNSSKTLHWVENETGSKNEYLCIAIETSWSD